MLIILECQLVAKYSKRNILNIVYFGTIRNMSFVSNDELVDVREMVADIRADSKESLQFGIN